MAVPVEPAYAEPRDAATLVIIDSRQRVLLGKRRPAQVFAPGKFVFPGGSVNPADTEMQPGGRLRETERYPLLHDLNPASGASSPEVFALAAIRETFEETGLLVGARQAKQPPSAPKDWQSYVSHGCEPRLNSLTFIARAITPPGRPRRFDARFFLAPADDIVAQTGTHDGEFEALAWMAFAEARAQDLHSVTRSVLEETEHFLTLSARDRTLAPVPYFFEGPGGWHRDVIARQPVSLGA